MNIRSFSFSLSLSPSLLVSEIVEGVKRGGGSPLRPAIDDAAVEEEVRRGNLARPFNLNYNSGIISGGHLDEEMLGARRSRQTGFSRAQTDHKEN